MKSIVLRLLVLFIVPLWLAACGGSSDSSDGDDGGAGNSGTLALSTANFATGQATGSVTITATRSGGTSGAVTAQYSTSNGTASAGTDYTAGSGTLSWSNGDAGNKTFAVTLGSTGFTGTRAFNVALATAGGGATIGTPSAATVTITGSGVAAVPGTLALSASTYSVQQSAGSATITVTRSGGSSGAVSIQYATNNGTAGAGTDYAAASGTLNWADGDTAAKTFTVSLGSTAFTGTRAFNVALATAGGGATIGTPSTATVTITGSGVAVAPGTLALNAATYPVQQSAGSATITVTRAGGSSGAVSVQYATSNGTAAAGTDYTAVSGTLNWANGDAAAKTFTVTLGGAAFNGTRAFNVALATAGGGATIGTPSAATVTITGSGVVAAPGTLALNAATYQVQQSAGSATITVTRIGGSSGAVSVQYATSNGTASAGTDYTATSGTLNWADGDSAAKTFTVALGSTGFTGARMFNVALATAGGGATLGIPATATITITGSGTGGPGTTSHVNFTALPSWSGGFSHAEWINGETRLVKDNNPAGSGELFGFVWPDNGSSIVLLASADNGQSWRVVSSAPSNGCGSPCPGRVITMTQDSAGKVHAIGWASISDSGYYLRFTLAYSGGHISGYSLDTPGGIKLKDHNRRGTELRADIKMIQAPNGAETVAWAVNMPTLSCTPVCDIKVFMGRATSLAPTSAANLVGLAGTVTGAADDTLVFDSCAISACNTFGFSTHVHSALFAQNGTSHALYLFQGPIDGDYGLPYSDSTFNTLYMVSLPTSASGWTVGARSTISSRVQSNETPELMSVANGSSHAWLMYVDPANGVKFGQVDANGIYTENAIPSPDATTNRNGWGVFSVSADDTKIWAIWDTLQAVVGGGTARAFEGYWNGSTWTTFADAGASDSMGMAGIAGWRNGTAAILFNGAVGPQTYKQPTAATIWTE